MKRDPREHASDTRATPRQPDRPELEQPEEDTNLSAHAAETGVTNAHDPNREFHAGKRSGDPQAPAGGGEPYAPKKPPPEGALPVGFHPDLDPASVLTDQPAGISQPGLPIGELEMAFEPEPRLPEEDEEEDEGEPGAADRRP